MGQYLVDPIPLKVHIGYVRLPGAAKEFGLRQLFLEDAFLVGSAAGAAVAPVAVVVAVAAVVIEIGLGLRDISRRGALERGRRQGYPRRVGGDVGQPPPTELCAPGGRRPDRGDVAKRAARSQVRHHGFADLLSEKLAAQQLPTFLVPRCLQQRIITYFYTL